mgnify:CR=1 FL=1
MRGVSVSLACGSTSTSPKSALKRRTAQQLSDQVSQVLVNETQDVRSAAEVKELQDFAFVAHQRHEQPILDRRQRHLGRVLEDAVPVEVEDEVAEKRVELDQPPRIALRLGAGAAADTARAAAQKAAPAR